MIRLLLDKEIKIKIRLVLKIKVIPHLRLRPGLEIQMKKISYRSLKFQSYGVKTITILIG